MSPRCIGPHANVTCPTETFGCTLTIRICPRSMYGEPIAFNSLGCHLNHDTLFGSLSIRVTLYRSPSLTPWFIPRLMCTYSPVVQVSFVLDSSPVIKYVSPPTFWSVKKPEQLICVAFG